MAEQNKEKLYIKLLLYDEPIQVRVDREEEEHYRAAAKLITERYGMSAQAYKGHKGDHTIALMALLDIALMYQKEHSHNDTTPYDNILSKLTAEIEDALKG